MAYKSKFTGKQIDDYLDSIGTKQDKLVDGVNIATINGQSLTNGGDVTIEGESLTESDIAAMGFTKNTGTYSKPSSGIPKSDLASAVQTSLGKADTALQSYTEQYKGTVTGVKINGTTKNPSSGVVDLGTVITAHQDISGKQDKLVSGTNIKTINGTSILGNGDLTIDGGAKIYELDLTGRGNLEGYITEEEWNIIKTSDRIKIITDVFSTEIVQIYSPLFELVGDITCFTSACGIQGGVTSNYVFTGANITEGSPYSYQISENHIPTKTSELENNSNFITSDNLKTINGESILGSGDIVVGGKEIVQCKASSNTLWFGYSEDEEDNGPLEPNKVYIHSTQPAYDVSIYDIVPPDDIYGDYTIMFKSTRSLDYSGVLEIPDYVLWANGTTPTLEAQTSYELSITATKFEDNYIYKAVLTPFKPVE